MSDNKAVTCGLNVVLCGATCFGFCKIKPSDHPYAFTSCLIGFCHGLVGLATTLLGDDNAKKVQETTTCIMEIIPLPLVNVQLYLSGNSNNIALGHGLFMVPLAVNMVFSLFKGEGGGGGDGDEGGPMDTLKIMTILGNITSLSYVAINESSWPLAGMVLFALMAKFGAEYSEANIKEGTAMPINYISWSAFYIIAALVISGEK